MGSGCVFCPSHDPKILHRGLDGKIIFETMPRRIHRGIDPKMMFRSRLTCKPNVAIMFRSENTYRTHPAAPIHTTARFHEGCSFDVRAQDWKCSVCRTSFPEVLGESCRHPFPYHQQSWHVESGSPDVDPWTMAVCIRGLVLHMLRLVAGRCGRRQL